MDLPGMRLGGDTYAAYVEPTAVQEAVAPAPSRATLPAPTVMTGDDDLAFAEDDTYVADVPVATLEEGQGNIIGRAAKRVGRNTGKVAKGTAKTTYTIGKGTVETTGQVARGSAVAARKAAEASARATKKAARGMKRAATSPFRKRGGEAAEPAQAPLG